MARPNKWTEEEVEQLKYLWYDKDKNMQDISIILNRTYNSVKSFIGNNKLHKNHKWTNCEKDLLKQMYYDYIPSKTIAKKMDKTNIASMINALKLSRPPQVEWTKEELNILRAMYPKNISQEKILAKLNNKTWVQAKNKAISQLKLKRPRFKPYNAVHNYFSDITTINQAYILGFIAADGCIRTNNHGIHIGVHNKDEELLNFIISEICPDYKIKYSNNKTTNKYMSIFEISDKQMNYDLQKYNMVPQKTFNIQWPNLLPTELEIPFILGVFDGDGCLSCKRYANEQFQWAWEIYGGQQQFLQMIKEKIYQHSQIEINDTKNKRDNVYRIALNGPKVYDLDEYMSQYDIGLKRKRIQYFWDYHEKPF